MSKIDAIDVLILKQKERLRYEAKGKEERFFEEHKYIANRVDGGFLEREPGNSLPQLVKDVLIGIRNRVDEMDAQNAEVFCALFLSFATLDNIKHEYESGNIEFDGAVAAIKQVTL